jgi:hypothetical protein
LNKVSRRKTSEQANSTCEKSFPPSNIFSSSVCRQYEAEFQHDVWLAGWLVAGWEGATKSAALHEKDRIEWNIVLN